MDYFDGHFFDERSRGVTMSAVGREAASSVKFSLGACR
jgi:hypothetical protein